MDVKAATRIPGRSAFNQIGQGYIKNEICRYWLAGNCTRNPCKFLHPESPDSQPRPAPHPRPAPQPKQVPQPSQSRMAWRNPNYHAPKSDQGSKPRVVKSQGAESVIKTNQKSQQQLCKFWVTGNCVHGDKCKNLHSWFVGDGFTMLAKLEGHTKAVTGIALPAGSDKLFSVSSDKSMRIWDCNTGQCAGVINFDSECGTLINEGPCVFVGLPSVVKAWNIQEQSELTLNGPVGQVHAMVVGKDMLFAGLQDGTILAWKTSSPEAPTMLKGHSGAVLSLVVGAKNRLYSGSMDKTIKVWDLERLQCLQTLHGHSSIVMSVLCWDSFLLSGSLDSQIKVWAATESGKLEVVYEHNVEHGVLALCGIHDAEGKPILLCSCNDNSVRLYDLPSFTERGRVFAKREVRALQVGTDGLFFTGDATGQLTVWKLIGTGSAVVPS